MGGGVLSAAHNLTFLLRRAIRQMIHITLQTQPSRFCSPAWSCARCIQPRLSGCRSCFWRRPQRHSRRSTGRRRWQSDCPRRAAKRWPCPRLTRFTAFAVPETCCDLIARGARREQGVAGGGVDGDRGECGRAEGDEEITCFHFNFSFGLGGASLLHPVVVSVLPRQAETPQKSASPGHWPSRPLAYFVQKTIFKLVALEISKIVEGFPPRWCKRKQRPKRAHHLNRQKSTS